MAIFNRFLIIGICTVSIIISIILKIRVKGSAHEYIIGYITRGFIFIATAKLIAITTVFCIENKLIPKSFIWITQVYEVFGLIGLLMIVASMRMLLVNKPSVKELFSRR